LIEEEKQNTITTRLRDKPGRMKEQTEKLTKIQQHENRDRRTRAKSLPTGQKKQGNNMNEGNRTARHAPSEMRWSRSETTKPDTHRAPTPADWSLSTAALWTHNSSISTDTAPSLEDGSQQNAKRKHHIRRQDAFDKRTWP
jgi:hypothetical protein